MSHAEAWAGVALDLFKFVRFFGCAPLLWLAFQLDGTEVERELAFYLALISLSWWFYVTGIAAGYWT